MTRRLLTLLFIAVMAVSGIRAQSTTEAAREIGARLPAEITGRAYCDTIADIDGYTTVVAVRDSIVTDARLRLFADDLKSVLDAQLLEFAETALLAQALGIKLPTTDNVTVTRGAIGNFRNVSPHTKYSVNTVDSRLLTIQWTDDPVDVAIELPLGYDTGKGASRSEIENRFIGLVRSGTAARKPFPPVDLSMLEPYGTDSLSMLPGATYQLNDISRNIYLAGTDTIAPVWSTAYPLESLADLIIYPADIYPPVNANLHILKHKYGESEDITVPLSSLLAAAEQEGCTPFWGVAKYEDGRLEGSIFLVNMMRGYEHLVSLECNPAEVVAGTGDIKARVSLYIPNNNVQNLYQPFVKRAPKAIEIVKDDENEN